MEVLEKLFGSSARVKVLRLFLLNDTEIMEREDVAKKAKVSLSVVTKELNMLEKIGFLKKRSFFKAKKLKGGKTKKVRTKGFAINDQFKLLIALQNLLINDVSMSSNEVADRLNKYGKIKVVIASGIFIQDPDSRIDLLIVADDIKHKSMQMAITGIEAEIGKSIRYAIFNSDDFKYRLGVYDRLVRDVLDYPHEIVVDKIGV